MSTQALSEQLNADAHARERFLYSSYYAAADEGEIFYKRVRTGLRWNRRRFAVSRVETEVGVFEDHATMKIRTRRYNHFGVPA